MRKENNQSRVPVDVNNLDPDEDFQEVIVRSKLIEAPSMSPRMQEAVEPGDIISFEYGYLQDKRRYGVVNTYPRPELTTRKRNSRWSTSQRVGLVVKSDRTTGGSFLSTKGNLLLNVFLINNISEATLHTIFSHLYKNRNACSYRDAPKILNHVIGHESFRTFKFKQIRNIYHMSPDWSKV